MIQGRSDVSSLDMGPMSWAIDAMITRSGGRSEAVTWCLKEVLFCDWSKEIAERQPQVVEFDDVQPRRSIKFSSRQKNDIQSLVSDPDHRRHHERSR